MLELSVPNVRSNSSHNAHDFALDLREHNSSLAIKPRLLKSRVRQRSHIAIALCGVMLKVLNPLLSAILEEILSSSKNSQQLSN